MRQYGKTRKDRLHCPRGVTGKIRRSDKETLLGVRARARTRTRTSHLLVLKVRSSLIRSSNYNNEGHTNPPTALKPKFQTSSRLNSSLGPRQARLTPAGLLVLIMRLFMFRKDAAVRASCALRSAFMLPVSAMQNHGYLHASAHTSAMGPEVS